MTTAPQQPTEKQKEIAALLEQGKTPAEIAKAVGSPERIVKSQISRLSKMGALHGLHLAPAAAPAAKSSETVEDHIAAELEHTGSRLSEIETSLTTLTQEREQLTERQRGLSGAAAALGSKGERVGDDDPQRLAAIGQRGALAGVS